MLPGMVTNLAHLVVELLMPHVLNDFGDLDLLFYRRA